jgi:small multidrug resistance family-3 protein
MKATIVIRSLLAFLVAGLCEIGGGYLVWLWLRGGRPAWYGLLGALVLFLYGVVQTRQPADFGSAYAAYGGIFIALALLWGWRFEGRAPDRFDLLGASLAILGALIIVYAPRR